jgi:UDP-glucose 4-epimerase
MEAMMRIYITGGTGFIGSYIVKALSEKKHQVIVLARDTKKVPALAKLSGVTIVKAPMQDMKTIKKIIKKPDAVIHVALCWGDTGPDMIKNETLASVDLIQLAINAGAKKIIFTSSTAAHGSLPKTADESAKPMPNDFYGATKGAVELFMSAYSSYHKDIQFNTIRPGYTFGNPVVPGGSMENDKRFFNICGNTLAGKDIELIKNDGTQFIWAGDLAKIYLKILSANNTNETYYGLSRNFVTWAQIARWAIEFAKSGSKIKLNDLGWGSKPSLFSVNKIKNDFGLSFNSSLQLKEHVKFLIEHPETYKK